MLGATLQGAAASFGRVKVIARVTVIDREDISASQLLSDLFNPFQGREVHFSFVRSVRMSRNCFEILAQLSIRNFRCDEIESIGGLHHAPFLPLDPSPVAV